MKKNAMLKIAAILMVAVLLTTCAISSTFAKYTTSAEDTATARVAKFGVDVKTSLKGLFSDCRVVDDKFVVKATGYQADDDKKTDFVVAPGMSGEVTSARTITGTPEVAIEVVTKGEVTLSGWADGKCPLVFTIKYSNGKADAVLSQNAGETVQAFEDRIEAAIHLNSQKFEAGKDLSTIEGADITKISWKWEFEAADNIDAQDEIDTAIGYDAANGTDSTVTIKLETSVTQIQSLTAN